MKKWIYSALVISLLGSSSLASTTANAKEIVPVYYNGKLMTFNVDPVTIQGRTMVEFRPLFQQLGYSDIEWDAATQTVTAKKPGTTIQLQIGSKTAFVNGVVKSLDVAAQTINGHTIVPLRFVSDASGKYVAWHDDTHSVTISDSQSNTFQPPGNAFANYPNLVPENDLPSVVINKTQLEQAVVAHLNNGERSFPIKESITSNISSLCTMVTNIFMKYNYGEWYVTGIQYSFNPSLPLTVTVSAKGIDSNTDQEIQYTEQKVKQIIQQITNPSMSDIEKEKAINDWVVTHVEYDQTYTKFSAYDALTTGQAVCEGYSSLTYMLLKQAGIQNYIVASNTHSWNLVYINGQWYHLDTTWDDPIINFNGASASSIEQAKQQAQYKYFNRTDADITIDDTFGEHTFDHGLYPASAKEDLNPYK